LTLEAIICLIFCKREVRGYSAFFCEFSKGHFPQILMGMTGSH